MARLCGFFPGGLAVSVVLVGMFLAASTGIVGATVVTMGLMSLPVMLKQGYDKGLATGTLCATGTLGQIIPPSIALVLLGDVLSTANQRAQISQGIFDAAPISVGDLFVGAVIPGVILVGLYLLYVLATATLRPHLVGGKTKPEPIQWGALAKSILPPLVLIALVLGSIIAGVATPTEAAAVGAVGALLLALVKRQADPAKLLDACRSTVKTTVMVFTILIGASIFSLVFRGFGGEELVTKALSNLPGGVVTATFLVLLAIFLLGFILDFIEITFVVVPLVAPVLLMMGIDPLWLGVMIAINLQTSFLTPPFGFSLFYLRGVAPESVLTSDIYRGVVPFVVLQLLLMVLLALFPGIVNWLPQLLR
jgi:tripartite ATP-independent transporter DctM subunit